MNVNQLRYAMNKIDPTRNTFSEQEIRHILEDLGVDAHQFYQELEMTSQFVDAHEAVNTAGMDEKLHSHSFHEILFCRNTCGAEYLVGTRRYLLRRGDIIYIPPGISHCLILPEKIQEPFHRYVLWVSRELADFLHQLYPDIPTEDNSTATLVHTAETRWEYLEKMFQQGVLETQNANTAWEAAVLGNSILLLSHIKRTVSDNATFPLSAEKPALLEKMLAYIEYHYTQKITVAELSRELYVSPSTITHIFRKKMGVSLTRYVNQRRLIEAKCLIEKDMTLELVAQQCGFWDYSTFYRVFRQEYGINPTDYRKRIQSENY